MLLSVIKEHKNKRKEMFARRTFVFPHGQPSLKELERFVRSVFELSSLFLLIV